MRKIGIIVCAVMLCIVAGGVTGKVIAKKNGGKTLLDKAKDSVDKKVILNSETVEDFLEPAGDLISQRYYYKDVDSLENYKEFLGLKVPLTTDKALFTYNGIISAGIALKDVKVEVDNEEKIITVKLPIPRIISNEISEDSFTVYEIKNSIFTETKLQEYADLMAQLKKKKAEQMINDEEFMTAATDEAKKVILGFLKAAEGTEEYEIIFE